ncbi:hypothetical protein CHS0354_002513 [Potamilus streckersoni]|uniref:Nucleolar protein 10 n=1 Tax=Potamilus streckersoni TaxID=2493646 RepID=A0AAE0SRR0_9BIVA|nr:hypothetical protein CHS0354_002513 [Potamilus streckersoni]
MQVSNPNNVKIYNLSAGKSLPEWLSDRKKRVLQKQDVDIRRRIELIQDFEMPTVSHCVRVSPDNQYIYVAGTYKPRIRCYDVHQMSLKFERGLDSDVVSFQFLSDDYTKIAFLQCDRFLEFHTQFGRYYRTRIPKYGRDMAYHSPSCDLYLVGVSSEIYRLNLEQGRFLNPISTKATAVNCCEFNPVHNLFACGTSEGHVECFDPRVRSRVGILDTALSGHIEDLKIDSVPSVTALKFRGGLHMGVGTSTGHVLLYDLRSDKPLLVKDHKYEMPIKRIVFHDSQDLVLSIDSKILKIWNRNDGKPFTAVEPGTNLNDLCMIPGSGMVFMANEAPKVLTYYIPALGTAPKWCSFLDNLTEELEETELPTVYDDYKFVTRTELDELGLTHLIGSSLLRAYMHGFFIDIRLYHKAKALAEPFAYEDYRKKKIREKIEEERANRVSVKKLPKVNRELAQKLIEVEEEQEMEPAAKNKKKVAATNLLKDDRFSAMFQNPDFQIDSESVEYRLLNPVVSKLDKAKKKKLAKEESQFEEVEEDEEGSDASSSDDEHTWTSELKQQHKQLKRELRQKRKQVEEKNASRPRFFEVKEGQEIKSLHDKQDNKKSELKKSLAERLEDQKDTTVIREHSGSIGNKTMTFSLKKSKKEDQIDQDTRQHHMERKKIRRSAGEITKTFKTSTKFWRGKRGK